MGFKEKLILPIDDRHRLKEPVSEDGRENNMNRREFMVWGVKRTGEALIIVGGASVVTGQFGTALEHFFPKDSSVNPSELPKKDPSQVSFYSGEIVAAAAGIKKKPVEGETQLAQQSVSAIISNLTLSYFLRQRSLDENRVAGILAGAVARAIDGGSTTAGVKIWEDPRFKEYGLDKLLQENNFFNSGHPKALEFLTYQGFVTAGVTFGSISVPAIGRSYFGYALYAAYNNITVTDLLGTALILGDEVKDLLANGFIPDQVRNYLSQRSSKS